MIINAKNYWTKLLPLCIKKTYIMPTEFYYLITSLKTLKAKIEIDTIEEYINTGNNLNDLIEEIIYTKGLKQFNKFYITSSHDTREIEGIIETLFKVSYIDDEHVKVTRY